MGVEDLVPKWWCQHETIANEFHMDLVNDVFGIERVCTHHLIQLTHRTL